MSVREIGAADERAWRELALRAVGPNPFFEPECVLPAAIHQIFGAEIRLAVVEEAGRFLARVPVRVERRCKGLAYRMLTSHVRRTHSPGFSARPVRTPR